MKNFLAFSEKSCCHYGNMASKTKIMRQQEEQIKQAIVRGHRNGICDKEGNSLLGTGDVLIAKPSNLGPLAKTYVYRNGKMVLKG